MLLPGHAREFLLAGRVVACGALAAAVSEGVGRPAAETFATSVATGAAARLPPCRDRRTPRPRPTAGGGRGLALPEVALRRLTRRSRERLEALRALEELPWGDSPIPLAPLRKRAAAAFAPLAAGPELARLASRLQREHDRELDAAVRAALTTHPDRERVRELFHDLPTASAGEER